MEHSVCRIYAIFFLNVLSEIFIYLLMKSDAKSRLRFDYNDKLQQANPMLNLFKSVFLNHEVKKITDTL